MSAEESMLEKVINFALYFDGRKQPIIHDYPFLPAFVIPLYLLLVYFGPRFMKNRKPFEMKFVVASWNFLLSFVSLLMFLGIGIPLVLFLKERGIYELVCMPKGEMYVGFAFFCIWVFGISKYFELFDTVILILRKKEIQFLHWYHHATVLAFTWFSLVVLTPPGAIFGGVNSFVHTVMYYYYFLAAINKQVSWSKYVTRIQISQMVVGILIAGTWAYYHFSGAVCPMSHANIYMISSLLIYISYLYLFLDFYFGRYKNAKAAKAQ